MYRRTLITLCLLLTSFATVPVLAAGDTISLNSPSVLGGLNLDAKQLQAIKTAIEKSLKNNTIDAVEQCGKNRMDCEVRTARTWSYKGDQYREVVVNIHATGNASLTLRNSNGQWTKISAK